MKEKKVLIIDDDPRNIYALSATLKAKGYANLSANGAQEGMMILKNDGKIGIILLDMMMPGIDGYQALQQFKKDPALASVPVIAVTAQAMPGDKEKCIEAGADDYISKPINVDLLMEKLSNYL